LNIDLLVLAIINGLMIGGIYSVLAVSLTLIFGVMKVVNFAHGNFMVLGMYCTYLLFHWFRIDPYVSILISFPILFVLGVITQKLLIRPVLKDPEENQILLTLGLLLFLENLALFIWGPEFRSARPSYAGAAIFLGDIVLNVPRLLAFGFSIIVVIILYLFLSLTDLGKTIRAAADEPEGALLAGINVNKVNLISFGIGIGCAGAAGTVLMPLTYVSPHIGTGWTILAFIIVVLGGLGNFLGALLGGLIIGVVESMGAVYMPGSLKEVAVFGIFILVLLFKPQGIFGRKLY
jgi:branched-chain amino acid transport system permease protein